jgi:Penicillin amidase
VTVPGLAMYILIGRTKNYAWSLTSAGHDVRDVFAEQLCEPSGSAPTRASTHYLYKGKCRPLADFNAGLLDGKPLRFKTSVHGPVTGTALVKGKPYALARKRSTFGRDALNLAALKDMTEGKASTPKRFYRAANQFGFTFNWAYVSRGGTANFSSGLLPKRARGLDRRLPTLGTGGYEWRGYLSRREHPHAVSGPGGLLLNWNNRSAPGFMHGDDEPYGSVQHVEVFDQYPRRVKLTDDVGIMNRAATEDDRSLVWPVVSKVLRTGSAPDPRAKQVVDILDGWVRRDAPRLDADENGFYDTPGPTIMDAAWRPIADAVMRPVFSGTLLEALNDVRGLGSLSGESWVDKDLRTLLDQRVRGRFNLRYCGNGSLAACRASLWAAIVKTADELAARQNQPDPRLWRSEADRTGFAPGLIPTTFRTTNRPTFQQVLEFAAPRRR